MSKKKKDDIELEEDVSLLTQLLDDENEENIYLFDDEDEVVEFEKISIIDYNGDKYAILRPLDADEDSAAVFKIDVEDEDSINQVEDDILASKIIDIHNESLDTE